MKNIEDLHNIDQKKILLRLDLNVPLKDGMVTDTTRIDKILPTINFLLKKNTKMIILSHVGRPNGKVVNKLSLKPICQYLKKKINENIRLITKNLKEITSNDLFNNPDEKIVMFENLRFYSEEENNDNIVGCISEYDLFNRIKDPTSQKIKISVCNDRIYILGGQKVNT